MKKFELPAEFVTNVFGKKLFRSKDKILRVQCGCFYGDLAQFREIVKKTHGDSKYAKEYLAIADLMELHFSDEE